MVEGNRRLATMQGVLNGNLNYQFSDNIHEQLKRLPVLFYPNRKSVLNFLGVHHLAGVRKWNTYERARYIISLKRDHGRSIEEIQNIIGDRKNSAKKTYICYRLIELIEEYDDSFGVKNAKEDFSFLQLSTGQGGIKKYIGLKNWSEIEDVEEPVPKEKREKLKNLFSFLFDSNHRKRVIRESRDITNFLSKILENEEATKVLVTTRNIDIAYDFTDGKKDFLEKLFDKAEQSLKTISSDLSTYKDDKESFKEKIENIETFINEIQEKISK